MPRRGHVLATRSGVSRRSHTSRHFVTQVAETQAECGLTICRRNAMWRGVASGSLVPVERCAASDGALIGRYCAKELPARATCAKNIELRRRDHERHAEAFNSGIRAGNSARESGKIAGKLRNERSRPAQAVTARIARRARLALQRLWPAARAAVSAARLTSCFIPREYRKTNLPLKIHQLQSATIMSKSVAAPPRPQRRNAATQSTAAAMPADQSNQ